MSNLSFIIHSVVLLVKMVVVVIMVVRKNNQIEQTSAVEINGV